MQRWSSKENCGHSSVIRGYHCSMSNTHQPSICHSLQNNNKYIINNKKKHRKTKQCHYCEGPDQTLMQQRETGQ